MHDELVKELRDSAEWADRLALLMGRAEGDAHAPVMREAADAIEELSADCDMYRKCMADERNKAARLLWDKEHCWIPVEERLPEERQFVLAWKDEKPNGFACVSFWMDNAGWAFKNITHWMPLPEPPKEV